MLSEKIDLAESKSKMRVIRHKNIFWRILDNLYYLLTLIAVYCICLQFYREIKFDKITFFTTIFFILAIMFTGVYI